MREVSEGVCKFGFGREGFEWELGYIFGLAGTTVCNAHAFGRLAEDGQLGIYAVLFSDVVPVSPRVVGDERHVVVGFIVLDLGIVFEMDVVGLVGALVGASDGCRQSVACIASILQDGHWDLAELVVAVDCRSLFGVSGFGNVGSLVFCPCDLLFEESIVCLCLLAFLLALEELALCFVLVGAWDGLRGGLLLGVVIVRR